MRDGGLIGQGGSVGFFPSFQIDFHGEVDRGFGRDGVDGERFLFELEEPFVNARQSVFDLRFKMTEVSIDGVEIVQVVGQSFLFGHGGPGAHVGEDGLHFSDHGSGAQSPTHAESGCGEHFADRVDENGELFHGRSQ